MLEDNAKKYVRWFWFLATPLIVSVLDLLWSGSGVAAEPQRLGLVCYAMGLSSFILFVTTFLALGMVALDGKPPKWIVLTLVWSVIGLPMASFLHIITDRTSTLSHVYFPGLLFCLNLVINFLIQTWVASSVLELTLFKSWPIRLVHLLFGLWAFLAPIYPSHSALIVISALVVMIIAWIVRLTDREHL